ncbi:hypothetical protein ISCGN_030057 [Ixodes scapularis]
MERSPLLLFQVLLFFGMPDDNITLGANGTASSSFAFFTTVTTTQQPVLDQWMTLPWQPGSSTTGGTLYKEAINDFFSGHDTGKMERSPLLLFQVSYMNTRFCNRSSVVTVSCPFDTLGFCKRIRLLFESFFAFCLVHECW